MNGRTGRIVAGIVVAALGLLGVVTAGASPSAQEPQPGGVAGAPDVPAAPLGTGFTYQGRLTDGDGAAEGEYDLRFSLHDDPTADSTVGSPVIIENHYIAEGFFTVRLDFGAVFTGTARYLEIGVRPGDSAGAYTVLVPRQELTPTPYALFAAASPWSGLVGVPAGFADNVDDDTTYSGGTGLTLVGTEFSVAPPYRLPQGCAGGQIAEWDGGSWQCGEDDTGSGWWSLTGDSGTDPLINFLGTTDGVGLVLAVSGTTALRLEPSGVSPNLIGGYGGNGVADGVVGAAVGGGGNASGPNEVTGDYGTVGGGQGNVAGGHHATVGGGQNNSAGDEMATVGGGWANQASGWIATVSGGWHNLVGGALATIGGGWYNSTGDDLATIGGGGHNSASASYATVGGGGHNSAGGEGAAVGGGLFNSAAALTATIGGGEHISVTGRAATVAGGSHITVSGDFAAIGGGYGNHIGLLGDLATIGGGRNNDIGFGSEHATIGGGEGNNIEAASGSATIGGGWDNSVGRYDFCATIGGGWQNRIGDYSTRAYIGGGYGNAILQHSIYATIGGGEGNTIWGYSLHATIGGGGGNDIGDSSDLATIGGGRGNDIGDSSDLATIGGGDHNDIGDDSPYATIPGGRGNAANGEYAFAAGRRAQANQQGAFVWADSNDFDFASVVANTFNVRATGGVTLVTGIDGSGTPNAGAVLPSGGGSWSSLSDRELKENLAPVDGQELLARLAQMPITTWNYKAQDPSIRHIGPMAQDFYAAFGLGESQRYINTLDADGVALAAIQGLYEQNQQLAAQNAALQSQVDALQQQNAGFEARLAGLERGGVSRSSALGLPTWSFLGGLALVGSVILWGRWGRGEG